jgi:hypothetical protein
MFARLPPWRNTTTTILPFMTDAILLADHESILLCWASITGCERMEILLRIEILLVKFLTFLLNNLLVFIWEIYNM